MDRSSHGVFVSKNQTEVNYLLQPRARETASPPLYFRSPQDCQRHPLVPSFPIVPSLLARSGGGTGNLNLNFKLCHYNAQQQKHFNYIRHKSGSCLFSHRSNFNRRFCDK
jgi:hypothetical protein